MANISEDEDDFYTSLANLTQTSNEDSMLNRPFDENDSDDEDFIMGSPVFGVVFDEIDSAIRKDEKHDDLPQIESSHNSSSRVLYDNVMAEDISQDEEEMEGYVLVTSHLIVIQFCFFFQLFGYYLSHLYYFILLT